MQKHHEPTDEVVIKATATILEWLQSEQGRAAIEETTRTAPVSSRWHSTHIGFAVGRYAHHISDLTIANANVDELCKATFGETVGEQAARLAGARGGKVGGKATSEAKTIAARENARRPRPNARKEDTLR